MTPAFSAGDRAGCTHLSGVRTADGDSLVGQNVEFNRSDDLPAFLQELQKQCLSSSAAPSFSSSFSSSKPASGGSKLSGRRRCGAGAAETAERPSARAAPLASLSPAASALSRDIERRQKKAERRAKEDAEKVQDASGQAAEVETSDEEEGIGSRASFVRATIMQRQSRETRCEAERMQREKQSERKRSAEAAGDAERVSPKQKRKKKRHAVETGLGEPVDRKVDEKNTGENAARGENEEANKSLHDAPENSIQKKKKKTAGKEKQQARAEDQASVQAFESEKKAVREQSMQKQKKAKGSQGAAELSRNAKAAIGETSSDRERKEEERGLPCVGSNSWVDAAAFGQTQKPNKRKKDAVYDSRVSSGTFQEKGGGNSRSVSSAKREGKAEGQPTVLSWERSTGKTLQGRLIKFRRAVGEGELAGRRRSKTRSRQKNIRKDNRPDHLKPPHLQLGSKVPAYDLSVKP
ncbi:hypothetical protein TGMAS_271360 [Toxoplasma gondii MAS]|uniref:Uncharacterized protein n=1 Tax=Toxoplasma gondii MAS TaxID=943118 RepID=A0A086QVC6_TOXGO|nr:hypothetical protein TGMAS_271360 [Toxoplasma gondii MAS]